MGPDLLQEPNLKSSALKMEFQEVFVCLFVFLAQYFGKTVGLENVLFTFTFL